MNVLGIESSCDDTAVAIVKDGHKVLHSTISSQLVHKSFGGVVPEIAAREHLKAISALTSACFKDVGFGPENIDLVCVTSGPGLIGSLLVGATFAKGFALSSGIPLIPVNHVRAHVHGALLAFDPKEVQFPSLALVVSGGHTHLYRMDNAISYTLLAHSVDDACGECFDKVAKLLGLGYPGGPIVEERAKNGSPDRFPMPKLINDSSKMFFSYSGLKTHIVNTLRKSPIQSDKDIDDICASFQVEAFSHIIRKVKSAINSNRDIKSVVVSGGVSANQKFKELVSENISVPVFFPPLRFCSDNAAMVASLGYYLYNQPDYKIPAIDSWDVFSGYKYEE